MKKLEAITLALLLGAAYTRGRKAGKFEGELIAAKRSKKESEKTPIDWETVGSIAQTVSDKIENYFEPSKTADTPVEETEKETPVEKTEKEEEDLEDLTIETYHYLICMKSGGPFKYDELYHMVAINDKNYVIYEQKAYRVYTINDNDVVRRFETKDGAQFV